MAGIGLIFNKNMFGIPRKVTEVEQQVEDNIKSTLMMGEFELPYGYGLGVGLWSLVFSNISDLEVQLMSSRIKKVLQEVEGRAVILGVDVNIRKESDRNIIEVNVSYKVKDKFLKTKVVL